jgi:hypothetical protein
MYYSINDLYGIYLRLNARKCDERDYVSFLIASTDGFTCTEAARCYPYDGDPPSLDAFTRLLQRQPPDIEALWKEVNDIVNPQDGFLVLDPVFRINAPIRSIFRNRALIVE